MSFLGLSEDGTNYSSLLIAKGPRAPNIKASNVIVLFNGDSFQRKYLLPGALSWSLPLPSLFPSEYVPITVCDGIHSLHDSHSSALATLAIQVPAVGKLLHWPVLTRYSLDDIKSNTLIPKPDISDLQMGSHVGPSKVENPKVVNVITSSLS